MPTPTRLSSTRSFPAVGVVLHPPAPSDAAEVSAEQAWANAEVEKRKDATYEIVLARLSAANPATLGANGETTPNYQDVLAWVVISHHVAGTGTGGGAPPQGSPATASTALACSFNEGLDPTDATTGRLMFSQSWGPGA